MPRLTKLKIITAWQLIFFSYIVFLCALCLSIVIEAIKKIVDPEPMRSPLLVLGVGGLGLIVNVIGLFMFHSHKEEDKKQITKAESPVLFYKSITSLDSLKLKPPEEAKKPELMKTEPKKTEPKKASASNSEGIFLHIVADFIGSIIGKYSTTFTSGPPAIKCVPPR